MRSKATERATKSANPKLRRSTREKNVVVRYGYNEYMAHYYAYMMRGGSV